MTSVNGYNNNSYYDILRQMQLGANNTSFGNNQSVGGISVKPQGENGSINPASNPYESSSLVDRLDKYDANTLKPSIDSSSAINGYDSELSVNGLTGVSGESIFVSGVSPVESNNGFASMSNRLDAMDGELHPETRNELCGKFLYLEG